MTKKLGVIFMVLGIVLITVAIVLVFQNKAEEQNAEKVSMEYLDKLKEYISDNANKNALTSTESSAESNLQNQLPDSSVSDKDNSQQQQGNDMQPENSFSDNIPEDVHNPNNAYVGNMLVAEIDGFKFVGYITIPKLGVQLPVLSETDMEGMKSFPCRFSGAPKTDNLVLGAHNYSVHFGNISNLSQGDTITFTDMEGVVWHYSAVFTEVLNPSDVDMLVSGEYPLTVYTCNYDGSQRIVLRCDRKK